MIAGSAGPLPALFTGLAAMTMACGRKIVWGARAKPPGFFMTFPGDFAVNIAGVPWTLEVTSLKQTCTF
jgi:hypothetical protein